MKFDDSQYDGGIVSIYAAPPIPEGYDPQRIVPFVPYTPSPELQAQLDEFGILAALDKLDEAAKKRVLAWLKCRLETP